MGLYNDGQRKVTAGASVVVDELQAQAIQRAAAAYGEMD